MLTSDIAHDPNQFEELLAGILEGEPDAQRNEQFCELLHRFPALQNDYVDLMELHSLLLWREGRVIASQRGLDGPTVEVADAPLRPVEAARIPGRWRSRAVKAAAIVCFGIALGVFLNLCFMPASSRDNGPEVVEQLVGWNLDIAQAPTHDQRQAIYDTRAVGMRDLVADAKLAQEDRELAQALVDTSSWLTANDDPVSEAERFGEIADQLLARLDSATTANDRQRMKTFADSYRRVTEVAISVNLDKASASGADPRRKPKLDRLIASDAGRGAKKLEDMLDRHPDASWKSMHRALKGHHRKLNNGSKPQN